MMNVKDLKLKIECKLKMEIEHAKETKL